MNKRKAKIFLVKHNLNMVDVARRVKSRYPKIEAKTSSIRAMIDNLINGNEAHPHFARILKSVYPELNFTNRKPKNPANKYKELEKSI